MNTDGRDSPPEVLSRRAIAIGSAVVAIVAIASVALLLTFLGAGNPADTGRLDALRTAGALVLGTGGAVALLLNARRQRSTELTLHHQFAVAKSHDLDAAERRVTELYTAAADQLGSDKAPVRLAGVYALERLAQSSSGQQATVMNLFCAYLRMPFEYAKIAIPDSGQVADSEAKTLFEELEVRRTVQRVVASHLRPPGDSVYGSESSDFWGPLRLDLTKATLVDLDFGACHLTTATFIDAQFFGASNFGGARLDDHSYFHNAIFHGRVGFIETDFLVRTVFHQAVFRDVAVFRRARFHGMTFLADATFCEEPEFMDCRARIDIVPSWGDASVWPQGYELVEGPTPEGLTGRWGIVQAV